MTLSSMGKCWTSIQSYEENDAIMAQRYKTLGGSIKVIVENKGHSHGMNQAEVGRIKERSNAAPPVG